MTAKRPYEPPTIREVTAAELLERIAGLAEENARLRSACDAVLMFYECAYWTDVERSRWAALTGSHTATTRVLCDFVRAALAKARGERT